MTRARSVATITAPACPARTDQGWKRRVVAPRTGPDGVEEGLSLGDRLDETVELVRRYQGGERAAGELLFTRLAPRVRRLVQLRLGRDVVGRIDVEDVAQETLLAALQSLDRFELREEGRLVSWLARIAEHRVLQAVRTIRRVADRAEVSPVSDSSAAAGFDPPADSTQVPERVARDEERTLVERALQALRPEHREVVLLRDFAACSWQGVADELGHPSANTAMKHYARARAALAAELARRLRESGRGLRAVAAHSATPRQPREG